MKSLSKPIISLIQLGKGGGSFFRIWFVFRQEMENCNRSFVSSPFLEKTMVKEGRGCTNKNSNDLGLTNLDVLGVIVKNNGVKLSAPSRPFTVGAHSDIQPARHQAPLEVMRQRTKRGRTNGKGESLSRFTPSIGWDKQAPGSITFSAKQSSFAFFFHTSWVNSFPGTRTSRQRRTISEWRDCLRTDNVAQSFCRTGMPAKPLECVRNLNTSVQQLLS